MGLPPVTSVTIVIIVPVIIDWQAMVDCHGHSVWGLQAKTLNTDFS